VFCLTSLYIDDDVICIRDTAAVLLHLPNTAGKQFRLLEDDEKRFGFALH